MAKTKIEELKQARKIILKEMDIMEEIVGTPNYLIAPATAAKVLGISLQAMEQRMVKDPIIIKKVYETFEKRMLSGGLIRDHFENKVNHLEETFESLGAYDSLAVERIVDYANRLEKRRDIYPPD
ncbi:MAG: hypothetical protein V5783_00320 [Pontiella sp.]